MIRVVKASLDEVSSMANIVVTTWKTAYKGIVSQSFLNKLSPKMYLERFKRAIRAPHILLVYAEYDGVIVGVLQAQKMKEINSVHIDMLYVLPTQQGVGVGSALLKYSMSFYKEVNAIQLDVFVGNPRAKLFYEKHGFVFATPKRKADINGHVCYVEQGVFTQNR